MLKVYGRANSINVRKVLWLLEELGIPYEREDWGRNFRPTSDPEYQAINPFAVVPTIDDDGFLLRESHAIVRYLAAKSGRSDLYPEDLRQRATVESWMEWANTDVMVPARPVTHIMVFKTVADPPAKMLEQNIAEWNRQMTILDSVLASCPRYLMGRQFTVADIPVGLVVNRWFSIGFDKPHLSNVARYYDVLAEREAYLIHGRNGTP